MRIEVKVDENPGLYLTYGGGAATWKSGGKEITAEICNDFAGGMHVYIGDRRFRLCPREVVAAIAEHLGLNPEIESCTQYEP